MGGTSARILFRVIGFLNHGQSGTCMIGPNFVTLLGLRYPALTRSLREVHSPSLTRCRRFETNCMIHSIKNHLTQVSISCFEMYFRRSTVLVLVLCYNLFPSHFPQHIIRQTGNVQEQDIGLLLTELIQVLFKFH